MFVEEEDDKIIYLEKLLYIFLKRMIEDIGFDVCSLKSNLKDDDAFTLGKNSSHMSGCYLRKAKNMARVSATRER